MFTKAYKICISEHIFSLKMHISKYIFIPNMNFKIHFNTFLSQEHHHKIEVCDI